MRSQSNPDQSNSPLTLSREDYPPESAIDAAKREVLEHLDSHDGYVLLPELWEAASPGLRTVTVAIEELQADGQLEMESVVRRTVGGES